MAPAPLPPAHPPRADSAAIGALTAIALVLATRLLLLLSLIGAFVLALYAMGWQTPIGLAVVIAFCLLTVVPCVWLDIQARKT